MTQEAIQALYTDIFIHTCMCVCVCVCVSHSVVSNSLRPYGLQLSRLLYPWDSPGKMLEWVAIPFSRGSSQPWDQIQGSNPGVFPTQGSNPHCRQILYHVSHQGSPQALYTDTFIGTKYKAILFWRSKDFISVSPASKACKFSTITPSLKEFFFLLRLLVFFISYRFAWTLCRYQIRPRNLTPEHQAGDLSMHLPWGLKPPIF